MRTLLKPERLCIGDIVGIIAPASPPKDPQAVDRAAEALEQFGFIPKLAENVRDRHGFLAGGDRERAANIMQMFTDKTVKAIICLRGGYGSARLLGLLDYRTIRRNVKIFSGFSDITSLHCAFAKKVNMISIHAPMLNGGLQSKELKEFTRASFFRTVMDAKPPGSIVSDYDKKSISTVRCGVAEGRLIGGNLSVLCAAIGTPFAPSFKGKILFIEDVNEQPYRLDRMLTQLLNAGLLHEVAGVAVGINSHCEDDGEETFDDEYRQSAADVMAERLQSLGVPVVMGLPFGHVEFNATIPVGAHARLDGDNGDLIILEAAVS
ncbi:MAG TPA: LD-carboxypeptidase [Candidatus Angelobacter sp.]|nr:LD-carboxypeptidase [Candidatus Angelobacter sp.]